jgi:hypothetical protein
MALPPQAIEKLIREPSRSQGAYRELLLISGAMFGLSIIIYAGLAFGYSAYLNTSLANVDNEIQSFNTGISDEEREQIQGFYSQLVNLRTLLAGHTAATPVLELLERTVQPDVYYTKLTLNGNTNQAILTGAATSLNAIASQASVLQAQPEVDHLDFNNAGSQTQGPWQFTMTVYLEPDVFHGTIVIPSAPETVPATDPEGDEPAGSTSTTTPIADPAPTSSPSNSATPTTP